MHLQRLRSAGEGLEQGGEAGRITGCLSCSAASNNTPKSEDYWVSVRLSKPTVNLGPSDTTHTGGTWELMPTLTTNMMLCRL